MSRYHRALTIDEIMAILEASSDEEEDVHKIHTSNKVNVNYIPPNVDNLSDLEDLDDDVLDGDASIHRDIAGEVEIEYAVASDVEGENISIDTPSTSQSIYKTQKEFGLAKWTKRISSYSKEPVNVEAVACENIVAKLGGKSPYELFSLFFDDQVVNMIVNYSNEYATQSNFELTLKPFELRRFIGILYLSGYHVLPQWKMYWGQDHNGLPIVKQALPRSRFYSIKRYIHLCDNNNLDKNDKFSKIRPVYDVVNEKFMQFGVFAYNLSIDEQMIPYFGRHSCKMFIRGKPIRFGFKAWCLCSSDGYLYHISLYGGASTSHDKTIGLGADVVLTLLKNITDPACHRVFFDNFFTSYHLMCLLNERRFFGTGTVRSNRIGGAKLPEKLDKGKYQALFDQNQELLTVRWRDNSNVTVLTNHLHVEPITQARRYDRKAHKYIHIPMPGLIKEYNTYMGGVDLHDNALANYRIGIRGKKWWWPLFTNLLGNIVVNSWKLHTLVSKGRMHQPVIT